MGRRPAVVDSQAFRQALGCFASGVTIVTSVSEAGPVGLVVSSFSSVSLVPPLVGFYVGKTSRTWPVIRHSGQFVVNILAADQEWVCREVVARADGCFDGPAWVGDSDEPPRLVGALAWIRCSIHRVMDAGDHHSVLGRVTDLASGRERSAPLVHHRGEYIQTVTHGDEGLSRS